MLKAILISVVVHVSVVYLIPSVQVLPPAAQYIEVERVWIETGEGTGQEPGDREQNVESEIQEQAQLDHIPTHLDAVDPDMIDNDPEVIDRDAAFIGIEPRLPENLQTLPQVTQFRNDATRPKLVPVDTVREELSPIEDIAKHTTEPEIQTEREIQLHDEVLLAADQRYKDVIHSQTVQVPEEEEISPGFTKLRTPEFIDGKSQEGISFRKIERASPDRTSPFMTRGELRPDKRDKLDIPSVRLPDTAEIPEQPEDDIVITTDKTFYVPEMTSPDVSSVPPDERIDFAELPKVRTPEFVSASVPSPPVEQREPLVASPTRTSLPPEEPPLSSNLFPLTSGTKFLPFQDVRLPEKKAVQVEEIPVLAAERALPERREDLDILPQSLADEPRSIILQQDIQAERQFQHDVHPDIQPPPVGTKRSFVIGGATRDGMVVSTRSHVGIFVQKDTTLPQTEELDVTLQEDDALKHIAADEDKTGVLSFPIEGPASERKVLSKPTRPPDVQIDIEVDIRLKFWVLPDGTVGEVVPLQRGDVRLERAAIEYLKNWRFTPVTPDQPKVWGIIPITYKLR